MLPTITVFGKEMGMYPICAIVGLFVSAFVLAHLIKKEKVPVEDLVIRALVIGAGLLVGGHFLYGLTNMQYFPLFFSKIFDLGFINTFQVLGAMFGGSVFYGGYLGSLLALHIYFKVTKASDRKIFFDAYAVITPLFHCFGRIGCFCGGCCYGIEADWGFTVHGNTLVPELNDVQRMPTPLIESACNLMIFFILLVLFYKVAERGDMTFYYMFFYSIVRFTMEFFRGDLIRGIWFGLSTSQWISIVLFLVAIIHFIRKALANRSKPQTA